MNHNSVYKTFILQTRDEWMPCDDLKADVLFSKDPFSTVDCGLNNGPVVSVMTVRTRSPGTYYITCDIKARYISDLNENFFVYSKIAIVDIKEG